jgi:hypothetical protein
LTTHCQEFGKAVAHDCSQWFFPKIEYALGALRINDSRSTNAMRFDALEECRMQVKT